MANAQVWWRKQERRPFLKKIAPKTNMYIRQVRRPFLQNYKIH